jgi:thymidylate kinase
VVEPYPGGVNCWVPINGCYLVVIEGPDKVGKETQSKKLARALQERFFKTYVGSSRNKRINISVEREEIPYNDGVTHKKIYDMLNTGEALQYPEVYQTFHAANRLIWQKKVMPQMTTYNDVIILDRWNISSWVYGRTSRCSEKMLQCVLKEIVEPDIVFVFDGDSFHTPERENDSYEGNQTFMAGVRHHYKRWVEENPEIAIRISANRPKEIIHEDLIRHCMTRLKFK